MCVLLQRMAKRAERFGANSSEEAKKLARAQRWVCVCVGVGTEDKARYVGIGTAR